MKKFHLQENKSPTHFNLVRILKEHGWQSSNSATDTLFNESWLEFSPIISNTLEYKHLLASFLQTNQLAHLMPETFFIDDNIWPAVLETLEASFSIDTPWILKPSMLNNGQHIHIFSDLNAIKAHFSSPHRMGGPQVLQRYIDKPQLITGPIAGHKFSIRQLVVLSTHTDSVLFPNGYLNIALKPYSYGNYDLLAAHLTNEHLDEQRINVVQRLSNEMKIYQPHKEKIIALCKLMVMTLKKQFTTLWNDNVPRFSCFGFDFMVDAFDEKIWLLEVNHGPCFPIEEEHPLFYTLYQPFWEQVYKHFIEELPSDFIILG
ncbi:tubulin-tyrosine ligase [uncultured Legionella sp.]|uniref:tubulin-tyrosine ligase n=1 Tax=uncultured Legionella sp. TaxID=210934 RepID=UPI002626387C|nr:tubulin-tyrosine ligase [uncultured Legionella sp.]